jgi:hypothetical protein
VTLYAGEMSEYVECCHLSVREASVALEGSYRDRDIYRFLTVEARRPPRRARRARRPPVLTARGHGLGR